MSHASRWEYFLAVYARYRRADRKGKHAILDEFCANTGYHRKYALRLFNGLPPERKQRRRAPRYSVGVVSILAAVWAAAGYPWVGAAEGAATAVDALGAEALSTEAGDGGAVVEHQCAADRSIIGCGSARRA